MVAGNTDQVRTSPAVRTVESLVLTTSLLTLVGVEKHFGGLPAVAGVDLQIDEGELVALVGPNGAGKSTLLQAVAGMQSATRGEISFRGSRIDRLKAHQVRSRGIAMVLQHPRVFESLSVVENVVIGAMFGATDSRPSEAEARASAIWALDFVGLADYATAPVDSLNLHQQRFLGLARALAGRPSLLLLDEVMAGLNDTELQASIDIVRAARDELGTTIVWVEHVMKAVMNLAERVVVLNFGEVIADGEPAAVMREPDVVTAYLGTSAVA